MGQIRHTCTCLSMGGPMLEEVVLRQAMQEKAGDTARAKTLQVRMFRV